MSRTLNYGDFKHELRAWLRRKIPDDNFEGITDDMLIEMMNQVCRDINEHANLHIERYDKEITAGTVNIELQGVVSQLMYFKYTHDSWVDQLYAIVSDTIVLKDDPLTDTEVDILYLRDIEEITDSDSDEFDLPKYALRAFRDLVRVKCLEDYGDAELGNYDAALIVKARQLRPLRDNTALESLPLLGKWEITTDHTRYDITDQRASQDSVTAIDDGSLIFVE